MLVCRADSEVPEERSTESVASITLFSDLLRGVICVTQQWRVFVLKLFCWASVFGTVVLPCSSQILTDASFHLWERRQVLLKKNETQMTWPRS
jgi:hypothetical protein